MTGWAARPPRVFDVVTGFFPEEKPKINWSTDPRPMLVTGVFQRDDGLFSIRAAYGSTEVAKVRRRGQVLEIGNASILSSIGLKRPTSFLLSPGSQHMILAWTAARFKPWCGRATPVLGHILPQMEDYVRDIVSHLPDLPMP